MENHDDEERPNARRDALMEAMAHISSARGILIPLLLLEEQNDSKARRRATKSAPPLERQSA